MHAVYPVLFRYIFNCYKFKCLDSRHAFEMVSLERCGCIYIYIYALCSVGIHGVYGISCTTYIYAYAYIYVCIYDCFSSNCLGRLHGSAMVSTELVHTSCSGSIYDACSVPFKLSI